MKRLANTVSLLGIVTAMGCATTAKPGTEVEPLYTRMTEHDLLIANGTVQIALETAISGSRLSWENPATGHSGTVTPVRTYKSRTGLYCRVYDETLTIGKQTERYNDTACRDPEGRWKPVKTE